MSNVPTERRITLPLAIAHVPLVLIYPRSMEQTRASLRDLARACFVVGTQSVGGGPSTLYLMRREFVERRRWLTPREFLEDWALSKLSLGINLVALSALIGIRIAGTRGVAVSLLALLLPAGAITLAVTIGYAQVRDDPLVLAALTGAGPVAAGMTVGMASTFIRQAVRRRWHGAIDYAYAAAAVAAGLFGSMPPILVIGIGVVVGVAFLRGEPARAPGDSGA